MLQVGDDDLVTGLQVLAAPRVRHQVDRLGGAAHEHDVLRRWRPDEFGNGVASLLVGVGGPCRQFVRGTVDVGVLVRVERHQPVDHHLRLLSGGRVVEPDQRLSVDDLFEDREVRPHRVDVEHLVLVGQLRHWVGGGEEVIVALIAGRCVRRSGHSVRPPQLRNRRCSCAATTALSRGEPPERSALVRPALPATSGRCLRSAPQMRSRSAGTNGSAMLAGRRRS